MNFKNYLLENDLTNYENKIQGILFLQEISINQLNENQLDESIKDWMEKFGLHAHKSGPGLIDYIKQFTKGAGQLILAAIKGDEKKIKELSKSIKKEDLLDFLIKLDTITLHLISGPIHMIDALTGWHIGPAIKKTAEKSKDIIKKIWQAILNIKDNVKKIMGPEHQKTVLFNLQKIEKSLPEK